MQVVDQLQGTLKERTPSRANPTDNKNESDGVQLQVHAEKKEKSEILERPYYDPYFYKDIAIEPPFFKLTRNQQIIYMLGTNHHLPASILPEPYLRLIHSCKQTFFESVDDSDDSKDTEPELIKTGFLKEKPDDDWGKGLTKDAEAIIRTAFQIKIKNAKKKYAIERLNIELAYWICHMVATDYGMDENLKAHFGKNSFGLESFEEVSPILPRYTVTQLNTLLVQDFGFLKNEPSYTAQQLENDKDYLTSKILYDKQWIFGAEEEVEMGINRNKAWLPQLNAVNSNSPAFVGVGASHLIGCHGLLRLMENEGWKVSKINKNGLCESIVARELYPQKLSQKPQTTKPILSSFKNFVAKHHKEFVFGTVALIGLVAAGRSYFRKNK